MALLPSSIRAGARIGRKGRGLQGRAGFLARELEKLVLPLAVLAAVWPATMLVQAATAGPPDSPRAAAIRGPVAAANLAALEASESALASEADAEIGEDPTADIAERAARLADAANAWHRAHPGSASALANAMSSLDDAIAALALKPSPGTRVAFEQALATYREAIGPGLVI
jgi:hypothetical protein